MNRELHTSNRRNALISLGLLPFLYTIDVIAGENSGQRIPFVGESTRAVGQILGQGWSGRLATDLSNVSEQSVKTEIDQFYIRTCCPLDYKVDKSDIKIIVPGRKLLKIPFQEILKEEGAMGLHIMECSGNHSGRSFGLLSCCEFDGVLIENLLKKVSIDKKINKVRIGGFSDSKYKKTMIKASWVFSIDELLKAKAFLATKMGGKALTLNHGAPLRLLVPNWYGCVNIKWVNEIEFVLDDEKATPQMIEFAGRTNQKKAHRLAKDYKSAIIDFSAMPVKVEMIKNSFKITGIAWGGETKL
jgi:hypothetical protein